MGTVSIIAAVIVLYLSLLGFRGSQAIRRREKFIRFIEESDKVEIEYLGYLSYQGGFPEIPTPQKLNLAVARDYVLLFTNKAVHGKLRFRKCNKIETFMTSAKRHSGRQSIVMWSPLNNFLSKETFRHFITINYTDSDDQENNIVLEHDSRERTQEIYEKIILRRTEQHSERDNCASEFRSQQLLRETGIAHNRSRSSGGI